MANTVSAAYQTLVAALSDAIGDGPAAVRVGNLAAIKSVYMDYNPEETGGIGKVLNIPLPGSQTGNITDIGVGDFPNTDAVTGLVPITIDQHPGASFTIRDFEQANSPLKMRNLFLDGFLKGIYEHINLFVTALINSTNFNVWTPITGTSGLIQTTDVLAGRANLSTAKAPLTDPNDVTLLAGPIPMSKILGNAAWTQESQVGVDIAEDVRRSGALRVAYGARVLEEQQMPATGSSPSQTFTAALLHRHAIAVTPRRLPDPAASGMPDVVEAMFVELPGGPGQSGIPVRVTMGYNQIRGGVVVTVDSCYGGAVVRADHGQILTIAQ